MQTRSLLCKEPAERANAEACLATPFVVRAGAAGAAADARRSLIAKCQRYQTHKQRADKGATPSPPPVPPGRRGVGTRACGGRAGSWAMGDGHGPPHTIIKAGCTS
jgi:hypothetical protein